MTCCRRQICFSLRFNKNIAATKCENARFLRCDLVAAWASAANCKVHSQPPCAHDGTFESWLLGERHRAAFLARLLFFAHKKKVSLRTASARGQLLAEACCTTLLHPPLQDHPRMVCVCAIKGLLFFYSTPRCRLHGVQEPCCTALAFPSPSIPLMHQQLSTTITFSSPETLASFNES
jgi:hypothetical protein